MKSQFLIFQSLPLVVLALPCGCVSDPVSGKTQLSVVNWTAEEELELGRQFAPNIEAQYDAIYLDREANRSLGELLGQMVELSPRRDDFEFQFKILNSSIPNALALPGGFVYITRGLLQELETEGQFISVMGHELGHIEHRHAMLNQSQSTLLGLPTRPLRLIAGVLPIGGRILNMAANVVEAPSVLLGLKFSRDQESQADERGTFFSSEMGYDPRDLLLTFELFERLERESSSGIAEFAIFRTHPLNEVREGKVEDVIARDYPDTLTRPVDSFRGNSKGFNAVLERMRARAPAYDLYDQAQALFHDPETKSFESVLLLLERAHAIHPDEPLFSMLAGEVAVQQEDWKQAERHFLRALGLYATYAPGDGHWRLFFYIGILHLRAGSPTQAAEFLQESTSLYPMNGTAYLFLGQAQELAGQQSRALASYEEAVKLTPSGSQIHVEARERIKDLRSG